MSDSLLHYQLAKSRGWDEIWASKEIPYFELPPGYKISVIPPANGADARFLVMRPDDVRISVYLDLKNSLGYYGGPHWEVYPDRDDSNSRCDMMDTDKLVKLITWEEV